MEFTFCWKFARSQSADFFGSTGMSLKGILSKRISPKTGRPRKTFSRQGNTPRFLGGVKMSSIVDFNVINK